MSTSPAPRRRLRVAAVAAGDNGARFRALVVNDFGNVLSNEAVLTVTPNRAPTGTITQPAAGTRYSGGMRRSTTRGPRPMLKTARLPASAFTWRVDFHHATHTHPFLASTTGARSGSFTIPTLGETAANVWYRIYLTVRDAGGLTHTTQRDILPRVVRLTLATNPAGLQVRLDGQPFATPLSFDSVVGIVRNVEAATPQSSGGTAYQFVSWSDGGAAVHNISTPAANTTYTAAFRAGSGTGTGLSATYFSNANLSGTSVARIDRVVDFVWGAASPAPGIGAETFSVRWTGQVQPQFTETYTFYTLSNDGVRLWVDGQRLVNNWTHHGTTENRGTIKLIGGQRYPSRWSSTRTPVMPQRGCCGAAHPRPRQWSRTRV